ncbi:guanidinobutyrase-like isoform X2 [Centruroides vittatus]|uniref:guanidinobutyrase-like isoform X2 n=1 Tax=Centruroides vittatus TaxID=120091 RepID=UPI0035109B5C
MAIERILFNFLKTKPDSDLICRCLSSVRNYPISGNELTRAGGISTFMRLPLQTSTEGLDVCFVGIPLDSGVSYRSGCRFGPRAVRAESALLRICNAATGVIPFQNLQIADIGDISVTIYDLKQAVKDIKKAMLKVVSTGCRPLTIGGDHTITYPILQAIKERYGPVGLIHVDAHADINDTMLNCKIAHGTTFRRAVEEELLDCKRVVQIGLRGTTYAVDDFEWPRKQKFRVVQIEECWQKSLVPLMREVRDQIGKGPVYISLDIDALDPAYAPGTGTPEIAGLTPSQMLEIIRGSYGLNIVGGDLVEVSPPYDPSGNTALTAANLLFELLCALSEANKENINTGLK